MHDHEHRAVLWVIAVLLCVVVVSAVADWVVPGGVALVVLLGLAVSQVQPWPDPWDRR